MADFKTHVSVGAGTGFAFSVFAFAMDWVQDAYMAFVILSITIVGSFMPDMDSKSGLPYKIIFGLYSLVAASLMFFFVLESEMPLAVTIIAPLAAFLIVRFVVAKLFLKFTVHRGMFHSIPATLISFFLALMIARFLKAPDNSLEPDVVRFVIATAAGLGYLCHLVLDEIWSTTFLTGNPKKKKSTTRRKKGIDGIKQRWAEFKKDRFSTKKSLGTALKFYTNNRLDTVFTYVVLAFLWFINIMIYDFVAIFTHL